MKGRQGKRGIKEGDETMPEKYGYARVSTRDQHEDRQIIALADFGVGDDNIYLDKLSGRDFDRPQ